MDTNERLLIQAMTSLSCRVNLPLGQKCCSQLAGFEVIIDGLTLPSIIALRLNKEFLI